MENESLAREIFEECGVLMTGGHFVYSSGRHGDAYVDKNALYPHTRPVRALCHELALKLDTLHYADTVIGPALSGITLSHYVADELNRLIIYREICAVYAEKTPDNSFVIRPSFHPFISGKNVFVVEDVITTGTSVRKVVEAVRGLGGIVRGVGCLCNRGVTSLSKIGDPPHLVSLLDLFLDSWKADECPLCAQGVPVNTNVGHGKEFLFFKRKRT